MVTAGGQNIVTEEDVLSSIDYIKQYWRDPRHWSTPRGFINLSIIFQVIFGMWFFHNTFWHLYDVPSWFTSCLMAFVVVKFPFYSAIVINKKNTPFMNGTLVGATVMMALNSFITALFWARSSGCRSTETEALLTTRHCSETLMSSMSREFHLSCIIFALQLHFTYLVMSQDLVDVDEARARGAGGPAYAGVAQSTDEDFEFKHPTNYGLEQFGTRSHVNSGSPSVRLPPGPSISHTPL